MDLVEIRKKARKHQGRDASLHDQERIIDSEPIDVNESEDSPDTQLPAVEKISESALKNYFPDLELATEEDYIQGLSGKERTVERETVQWLTFVLGQEEYALSLDVVLELIKPRTYTDLPKVPAYVKGILSLRGEVVPIIDLRERLKLGQGDQSGYQRIIICEGREQSIGVLVDRITQVVRMPKENIETAPLVLNEGEKDFVSGVGRFKGRMLILLNPEEILKI